MHYKRLSSLPPSRVVMANNVPTSPTAQRLGEAGANCSRLRTTVLQEQCLLKSPMNPLALNPMDIFKPFSCLASQQNSFLLAMLAPPTSQAALSLCPLKDEAPLLNH